MSETFAQSPAPLAVKLDNFTKYVRRQTLSRFLARYELFKMQLGVSGSIVECGVHHGGGLLAWAKLCSALDPYALHRRVYGFDTFEGFPGLDERDLPHEPNAVSAVGGFHPGYDVYAELQQLIGEHDDNRFLQQFRQVFLIRGDATKTIPEFIEQNSHVLVSLLFMDFDLYEPTRVALEHFTPRMGKGAILAFDDVNNAWWPGETVALLETVGLKTHRLERFPMDPNISFIVL
jgi:hypothetical protein